MRITGGEYKNRKLFVPEGRNVRPTSDRMRQTLFNLLHHAKWLDGFEIEGANVLDLFCGSGALGLEALSHEAKHCTFIDADVSSIQKNASFVDDENHKIIRSKLPAMPGGLGAFDLVFMDPPYFKGLIEPTVQKLIEGNALADNALIVIEAEKGLKLDLPLHHLDTRTQSQSELYIFRHHATVDKNQ